MEEVALDLKTKLNVEADDDESTLPADADSRWKDWLRHSGTHQDDED